MEYENFDLQVAAAGAERYAVSVVGSPMGETRQPVVQPGPLTEEVAAAVAALARLEAGPEMVRALGQTLHGWLFPPSLRALWEASRARAGDRGLRLRLRIEPPELSRIPWEFCHDGSDFLALDRETPLVRYIQEPFAPERLAAPTPLRLLLVLASPTDLAPLEGAAERARIESALAATEEPVALHVLEHATPEALRHALAAERPHVLHFVGHGMLTETGGALALEDPDGFSLALSAERVRVLLRGSGVSVVVLNACQSAAHGEGAAIMGVGPALVRAGVPAVIAMQFPVPDRSGISFSRDLYRALALGLPLDQAVAEMRVGSYIDSDDAVGWGTPVLFLRAPDGVLWQPPEAEPTPGPSPVDAPAPAAPSSGGGISISGISGSSISFNVGGDVVGGDKVEGGGKA